MTSLYVTCVFGRERRQALRTTVSVATAAARQLSITARSVGASTKSFRSTRRRILRFNGAWPPRACRIPFIRKVSTATAAYGVARAARGTTTFLLITPAAIRELLGTKNQGC